MTTVGDSFSDKTIYPAAALLLHWLTAGLIALLFALAWSLDHYPPLLGLHRSFGLIVFALTLIRLFYHFFLAMPLAPGLPLWQQKVARAFKNFIYFCLIAMPVSGFLGSNAARQSTTLFNEIVVPALIGPNKELSSLLLGFHSLLSTLLLGAVAIHAAAALFHHYVQGDRVLARMLGRRE